MITGHNNVFNLLSRGMISPYGWGFPPNVEFSGDLSPLRGVLMFLEDNDGKAQLLRWYSGIIRSFNPVWRSISGESEGYIPSMFHKPCLESNTLEIKRNTISGALQLGWIPGPETRSLTAKLVTATPTSLDFGKTTVPLQLQYDEQADAHNLLLPDNFKAECSISGLDSAAEHLIHFRPPAFNSSSLVEYVTEVGLNDIDRAGLLDAFFSLPRPEDKLAVAWLAVSLLEKTA